MNINEINRQIINCQTLNGAMRKQENSLPPPVINYSLLNAVKEHRAYFGMTSFYSIIRGLTRTKNFVKTVKI